MSWATFLVGLVGPLAARVLASMGLTLVTMAGLTAAVTTLRGQMLSNLSGLPSDGLLLGGLLGLWDCFGLILGGLTFCITWASTAGVWKLAKSA